MSIGDWRVGGLSWRLAISYFVVTLVAAMTIEAAFGLRPVIQQLTSVRPVHTLAATLASYQQVAPSVLSGGGAPDQSQIQSQILDPLLLDLQQRTTSTIGAVALLDRQGTVEAFSIATFPAAAAIGQASASGTVPNIQVLMAVSSSQTTIAEALDQAGNSKGVASTSSNGYTAIAVPVWSGDGAQYGVLVAIFKGSETSALAPTPAGVADSVRGYFRQLGSAAVYFVLLATVLGTLTGIVVSRNLRRRLRRITLAADAWSRGEFQVEARDPSGDELGQLTRHLNSMADQLQVLLVSRQELAVAAERNRLARDLHDSVKQHVFATTLQIAATRDLLRGDPDAAEQQLNTAMRLANEAQQELTSLIHELRPPALAGTGLVSALRAYCASWSRRMGIETEVRAQGEQPTPLEIEQALYRITQEALANVARHSQATEASVWIMWERSELTLKITDNGRGFDAANAAGKGFGLQSMLERTGLLGGSLRIEANSAGHGACVVARVPLLASSSVE
jgi:signal transduction histidine kinase